MRPIVHQPGNVVLGHLRQLFLKDAFQPGEDDEAFTFVVVVDHSEFNLAIALLDDGGLFAPECQ